MGMGLSKGRDLSAKTRGKIAANGLMVKKRNGKLCKGKKA